MRKMMLSSTAVVALASLSSLALADACNFTTQSATMPISLTTLQSVVQSNNYQKFPATQCSLLSQTISNGNFITNGTVAQVQSSTPYYYNLVQSNYCQAESATNPLTPSDFQQLNYWTGIVAQAAEGCESYIYAQNILQQSGANNPGPMASTPPPPPPTPVAVPAPSRSPFINPSPEPNNQSNPKPYTPNSPNSNAGGRWF